MRSDQADPAPFTRRLLLAHTLLSILTFGSQSNARSAEVRSASERPDLQPSSTQPIRIMPLGDSITESSTGLASYRFYLWKRLSESGYRVDFVGSMRGVRGGRPSQTDFDQDHEGHTGWRADEVLANISGWATAAHPDVVLIHLGTNDLWRREPISETVAEISAIIDRLRAANPRSKILVAHIIPSSLPALREIVAYNRALAKMVADKSTTASPVAAVDLATDFDPVAMTSDGVHPNDVGERFMAERWFAALTSQVQPILERRANPQATDSMVDR